MNPVQECVRQITEAVQQLRSIVCDCTTSSVVSTCFTFNLLRGNDSEYETRLLSPAKQCSFLIGILLESKEPKAPKDFSEECWEKAEILLETAFSAYLSLYFPSEQKIGSQTNKSYKVQEVAMAAFFTFFYSGLLASAEQVAERIKRYLTPFDEQLSRILGISATQALEICEWISDRLQKGLDDLPTLFREEKTARHKLLDEAEAKNWSLEDLRRETNASDYRKTFEKLTAALHEMGKVHLSDLETAFPHVGEQFWALFSIGRGEGKVLNFPTERSVADERPLVRLSDTEALCPLMNTLFSAVLLAGEQALSTSEKRESYFKRRDSAVERETIDCFHHIVGAQAKYHSRVFETPDLHHEHDLVIVDKKLCLIVEVKASPPVKPFRDPEKAFVRLRHAFRANTGIQKAYEQAMHIWRRLKSGETVVLYDEKGELVDRLLPELIDQTFCVCITRDNYGPLATDLSLLLEKGDNEPYPWATNVLDLEILGGAWEYFRWGKKELLEYLQHRIRLHGEVFSEDELVYAGYYVKHGSLEQTLKTQADYISLNPAYSHVFDDIYRHLHQAGPPVELKRTPPVWTDLRQSLQQGELVHLEEIEKEKVPKVGRNALCPCGSGKKYKKCHGR